MIAKNESLNHTPSLEFPASKKVYLEGSRADLKVPFREIELAPTKLPSGETELNDPVRVYDTSGPWSDPAFHGDVRQGLPALRASWIAERGDVEEVEGRSVQPIDNGYLSEDHARLARQKQGRNGALEEFARQRPPFRSKTARPVTQLHYARQGIITPEMEFIAIRENAKLQSSRRDVEMQPDGPRNSL